MKQIDMMFKVAVAVGIVAVMAFASSVFAAETAFVENFNGAIDPAWQIGGQNGTLSLTANPGSLRYTLQGLGGQLSWRENPGVTWPPSVFLARTIEGTSYTLRAKATYHLRWPGTGAQHGLIWITFDDGTYVRLDRGIDQAYNANLLNAFFCETNTSFESTNFIAPDDLVKDNYSDYTYWYEIVRVGQNVTVKCSLDGTTFVERATGTFATQLPTTQKIVINANVWSSSGSYVDYDFVSVERTPVRVTLAPSSVRPKPGEDFSISVQVESAGAKLYAAQVLVGVDTNRVALNGAAYADMFDPSARLEIPAKVSSDGVLLAMSLRNPAPALTISNSTFAVLNYKAGQKMGPTDLMCESIVSDIGGSELPVLVQGASIVIDDGIWGAGQIAGTLSNPYASDQSGINVNLWLGGTLFRTVTTDSLGNFSFGEVKDGDYRITVSAPQLVLAPVDVTVSGGGVATVPPAKLLGGDLNSDGAIDIADLTLMASSFGTALGQPGYNALADINKDHTINVRDLAILASHWGVTGR